MSGYPEPPVQGQWWEWRGGIDARLNAIEEAQRESHRDMGRLYERVEKIERRLIYAASLGALAGSLIPDLFNYARAVVTGG